MAGICIQGAGPHFCPGGNPQAQRRRGESRFSEAPYAIFVAALRLREAGGPLACALQGLVLGGGLAIAMLADFRVVECGATLSLGNLSRGMVPCMLLTHTLPTNLGNLSKALELYLSDDALPASSVLELLPLSDAFAASPQDAKRAARVLLESLAAQLASVVGSIRTPVDEQRFASEAVGLQLSLQTLSSVQTKPETPQLCFPSSLSGTSGIMEIHPKSARQVQMPIVEVESGPELLQVASSTPGHRLPRLPGRSLRALGLRGRGGSQRTAPHDGRRRLPGRSTEDFAKETAPQRLRNTSPKVAANGTAMIAV
ncbi:unnamed protein product [Polarella glacialis]|uniref:Uncharacterized protein n=1 Tax=Polarella glacialis TaxID=89957 RepID=A0A813EHB9_POLGL|nr:unnamed protein product [Polarella glacialis]